MVTRGRGHVVGKMGEAGQKVQTSSYETKVLGYHVYSTVTIVNNTVLLNVAKRIDLKRSPQRRKTVTLSGDGC